MKKTIQQKVHDFIMKEDDTHKCHTEKYILNGHIVVKRNILPEQFMFQTSVPENREYVHSIVDKALRKPCELEPFTDSGLETVIPRFGRVRFFYNGDKILTIQKKFCKFLPKVVYCNHSDVYSLVLNDQYNWNVAVMRVRLSDNKRSFLNVLGDKQFNIA